MAPTQEDAVAVVGWLLLNNRNRRKERKKREKWCKPWLLTRNQYTHINLLKELTVEPPDYLNYLRMNERVYQKLLSLVSPLIEKRDTVMRKAISPHERLTATLRFLATGRSYECLKFSTLISPQALGKIIPETCDAIYKVLGKYLQFPNSIDKWREIANEFEERWQFPHCIGAMDGKHIDIVPPANSGSYYYNYKGRHSMVLLAIVDATYRFILADFGTNGRISDGGVLQNTTFFEKLQYNELNIPQPKNVNESFKNVPYVFVADDAFPLRTDILKPFRQAQLDSPDKEIFNYRLSRARHIVENAFGIPASRFRIYHTQINLEPENIVKVVMATCALHNFLIEEQSSCYSAANYFYQENTENGTVISTGYDTSLSSMMALERRNQGNITNKGKQVRQTFMDYFMNDGKVSWQNEKVFKNRRQISTNK